MNFYAALEEAQKNNRLIKYKAKPHTHGYAYYQDTPVFIDPDELPVFKELHIEVDECDMDCWSVCSKNEALRHLQKQQKYARDNIYQLMESVESAKRRATIAALVAIAVLIWKVIETII